MEDDNLNDVFNLPGAFSVNWEIPETLGLWLGVEAVGGFWCLTLHVHYSGLGPFACPILRTLPLPDSVSGPPSKLFWRIGCPTQQVQRGKRLSRLTG